MNVEALVAALAAVVALFALILNMVATSTASEAAQTAKEQAQTAREQAQAAREQTEIQRQVATTAKEQAQTAREQAQAAREQTEIQRQVHIDTSQPYVWVDIRPDESTGTLLNLLIGNSGPTVATNVRVSIDPPLISIEQLRDRADAAQMVLAQGLPSLPPGRNYQWPLGQGFNLLDAGKDQRFTIAIEFEGPFGPVPTLGYIIDIAALGGVLDRPSGSLHQLTLAVKDAAKRLSN